MRLLTWATPLLFVALLATFGCVSSQEQGESLPPSASEAGKAGSSRGDEESCWLLGESFSQVRDSAGNSYDLIGGEARRVQACEFLTSGKDFVPYQVRPSNAFHPTAPYVVAPDQQAFFVYAIVDENRSPNLPTPEKVHWRVGCYLGTHPSFSTYGMDSLFYSSCGKGTPSWESFTN